MKKLHLALATHDIAATVADYTTRLECTPEVVVPGVYALWRTASLNLSVRFDKQCAPGELRHLGWEDAVATEFSSEKDVNGILWAVLHCHATGAGDRGSLAGNGV